ncbi:MAG: YdbL family protein [Phenylobacterium sp.]|uniref:YdbL family protein n=1 Tax=Phenylobacterium sp. TaxID=1871053 RepID=UPI0027168E6D|nr:YdbL family protein [Phenylobacterium sp.]MDO8900363.1 YdbL family protein [Phenylobacterium sp.]MDP2212609.1 YdbL family protein [Phenylobacterium sp.]
MTRFKHLALAAAILGAAGVATIGLTAGVAMAQTAQAKALVDAAKAEGVVGERIDGLLGFVTPSSDPALEAAVNEINSGRLQLYRQAAARNGVTVEAAGASAFTEVVSSRLRPGEFYQSTAGAWVRK